MNDDRKRRGNPGRKGRQPIFMLPPVITVLAGLMLAIQAVMSWIFNEEPAAHLIEWLAFIPARLLVPDQFAGGLTPLIWTPLTYGFLHGGWEHVLGNVAWLVIFGTPVARRYGVVAHAGDILCQFSDRGPGLRHHRIRTAGYLVGARRYCGTHRCRHALHFPAGHRRPHPETGEPIALGRRWPAFRKCCRSGPARNFSIIWIVLNCLVPLAPWLSGRMSASPGRPISAVSSPACCWCRSSITAPARKRRLPRRRLGRRPVPSQHVYCQKMRLASWTSVLARRQDN